MKRIGTWAFYAVGALAILYLALYAYVTFTGREREAWFANPQLLPLCGIGGFAGDGA